MQKKKKSGGFEHFKKKKKEFEDDLTLRTLRFENIPEFTITEDLKRRGKGRTPLKEVFRVDELDVWREAIQEDLVELKEHYRKKEVELEAACAEAVKQMEADMFKKLAFYQRFYNATKSIQGLDEQLFALGKSTSIEDTESSSDALRCLESSAMLGHVKAKCEFAQRVLQNPTSFGQDMLDQARRFLEEAWEQKDYSAAYHLGRIYENGWGVEKSWETANTFYREASCHGHAMAELSAIALVSSPESRVRHERVDASAALMQAEDVSRMMME